MKKNFYKKAFEFMKRKKFIIIILIIALIIRMIPFSIIYPLSTDEVAATRITQDGKGYDKFAINILENGLMNDYFPKRVPGYPLFIAGVYSLFGYNPKMVIFLQLLMNAIVVMVIYLIAKKLFKKEKIALLAATLYTINIIFISESARYYSEGLFTFLFSISILSFIYALDKKKIRYFALAGLMFSISVLVKPGYSFIIYPLIFLILINKYPLKQKAVFVLIIFLVFMAPLSLWKTRNLHYYGYFKLYSDTGHFLHTQGIAQSLRYSEDITFKEAQSIQEAKVGNISNPFESSEKLIVQWKDHVLNNPKTYFYAHFKKNQRFFLDIPINRIIGAMGYVERPSSFTGSNKGIFLMLLLKTQLYIEYFFLIIGSIFIFKIKDKKLARSYCLLIIMLLILIATGASARAQVRYKFPLLPLYLVISAYGMYYAVDLIKKWNMAKKQQINNNKPPRKTKNKNN